MNKPNLKAAIKSVSAGMKKHSPEILTGIGVAGMLTTVVLAVRATPKALMLMEQKREESNADNKLTAVETVKTTWKCYIPAAVTGTMSAACLIGASSVNLRRNAALAAAYTISESTLKEYHEKVVETIGEKKEQTVKDAIAKDKLEQHPVTNSEVIITEKGNTLCFDVLSGRYFRSDIDKIKRAINELNARMMTEMYISLNDYYYELGLDSLNPLGEDLGWNMDDGFIEPSFTSGLASDGTPCLVINYNYYAPRYDYRTRTM